MFAGWQMVEVIEKNYMGGGLVEVVEGPMIGYSIAVSKFDGFIHKKEGERVRAFVEISNKRRAAKSEPQGGR